MSWATVIVSVFGTAIAASQSRSARRQAKNAQIRQEERNKALAAEEAKERTQASFRQLGRRKRRATTGARRGTILTEGSLLGTPGGGGKTLIGE